jgi:UDP:flavonoid glycosyltransferase YjiC (YdhE family)
MAAGAVLTLGPAVDVDAVRVPEGVEVLCFAEHDRLMPGCAAVISHGGLGTVLRALAHGVPQVLLALGRDQLFNAGRVEQLEAGIQLPADAPPRRIRTALNTLLTDGRYRAAAERLANRIAAENPDGTAADVLERIACARSAVGRALRATRPRAASGRASARPRGCARRDRRR